MPWVDVFAVFLVSHLVGDYVLQTEWQARHKHGGLGPDPTARRALLSHIATYTLAFAPALAWLADELGDATVAAALAVAVPHLVQDDGRLIAGYARAVKGVDVAAEPVVVAALDQSLHVAALFALALAVGG